MPAQEAAVLPVNTGSTAQSPGAGAGSGGGGSAPSVNRIPVPKALNYKGTPPKGFEGGMIEMARQNPGVTGIGAVPTGAQALADAATSTENRKNALEQAQPENRLLHDFAKGAAVFGPDLINSINYLTTPRVPTPQKNRYTKLKRMNNRAQMAQIAEA